MQRKTRSQVQDVLTAKKHHKVWLRVASGLMAVVVFCTTYALILPAITLADDTYCGKEEHTHTQECYSTVTAQKVVFTCSPEDEADVVLHTHDESCYNDAGVLVCELPEVAEHTHTQECYAEDGTLTCELTQVQEHIHDENCLDENGELACGLPQAIVHQHSQDCRVEVTEKTQTCQPEEGVGHVHDEQCYDVLGELSCTLPEQEAHVHTEDCYGETEELVCGKEESQEGHTHSEDCYIEEEALTCGLEASDGHTHTDGCYTVTEALICGQDESEGHTHSDDCYNENGELVCGLDESDGHTHSQDCYGEISELTCGQEASEGHTHTEACYTATQTLACGLDESETHTHTEDCYETVQELVCTEEEGLTHQHSEDCFTETDVTETFSVLTCTLEEHVHQEQCFEEPAALTFTFEDDLVSGVVTLAWNEALPDDLTCTVIALDGQEDGYDDMVESLDDTLQQDSMSRSDIQLYQLEWTSDGEAYTLPEGLVPTVELTMLESLDEDSAGSLSAVVITEYTGEELMALEAEETAEAAAVSEDEPVMEESVATEYAIMALSLDGDAGDETDTTVSEDGPGYEADATYYDVQLLALEDGSVTANVSENGTFGVVATDKFTTTGGGYYKRITSVDELNQYTTGSFSSGSVQTYNKYVFVFNNGMYALEGVCSEPGGYSKGSKFFGTYVYYPEFQLHKVDIQEVAGNPEYVTIKDVATGTEYSPDTMPSENYILQQQHPNYSYSSNGYVYLLREYQQSGDAWFYMGNSTSWDDGIRFDYDSTRQSWRLRTEKFGYLGVVIDPPDSLYQTLGNLNPAQYPDGYNLGGSDAVGAFTSTETATVTVSSDYQDSSSGSYTNITEMQIYVYIANPKLSVPNMASVSTSSVTILPRRDRVTYDTYDQDEDLTQAIRVTVTDDTADYSFYASDTSTSNIETILGRADLDAQNANNLATATEEQKEAYYAAVTAAQAKNDGRIITDKSVVYGDDDYDAFATYDDGVFSVTLSALGQEWTVSEENTTETPIDVMFLADFSGSMTTMASTTGSNISRWQAVVEALNEAMAMVLEKNPNNRVGLTIFSNEAYTVLPMGTYKVVSEESRLKEGYTEGILSYVKTETSYRLTSDATEQNNYNNWQTSMRQTLGTSYGLYYKDSEGQWQPFTRFSFWSNDNNTVGSSLWQGTNIQAGFQQTYEAMNAATTTATVNGSSVARKPVVIFLSDGEPTFATFNYMDPVNGPTYGNGRMSYVGTSGYYTILSGNYFKNMISHHYGVETSFYSMGIGIYSSGSGNYNYEATGTTTYPSTDAYRRAVLYPSTENVNALMDAPQTYNSTVQGTLQEANYDSAVMLYDLLKGDPTAYVQNAIFSRYIYGNDSKWGYGVVGQNLNEYWLRGISNPYASGYCYSDKCEFYGNVTTKQIADYLEEIIGSVQVTNYGFLLDEGSAVTMTDPLGEGMEVKGEPVLSFFGTLYKNPTKTTNTDEGYVEYTWSATATRQDSDAKGAEKLDLSGIKARVYTDDDGSQTVKFIIPDDLMPTLYPDNYQQFYYEEQPVRLIYQVGLTATAYASATDGDTFYTNLYDSDTGAAGTTVTFTPDGTNEYYTASYQGKTNAKGADANATETSPNCFTESVTVNTKTVTGDDGQETQQPTGEVTVTQTLGNNGKLTVHKTPTLTLTKAWDGVTNTPNNATVYLFQEKTYADGSSDIALFKTYTLSSSNDWSAVQKGMVYAGTDAAKGDYTCQYYVMESLVGYNSYNPTYTDGEGSEIAYVLKDVTVSGAQYNNARLYPVTDSVTITNRPQTFTIQKTWTDDDVGANSIQVNIYRTKTAVQGSSRTSTTELLDTVTLDSDNDWTYTYTDAPAYAFNFTDFKAYYYDYYVEEVPVSGYGATYSYGEGDALLASVLTVSGESVHAYPVTSAITITNTKTVPKVTVTKSWSDSDTVDHSGDSVQVGLYAQIEIAYETEDPGTGQTVTTLVPGYLYKGSATLQADNNWTHTWTLDDIGTTYYAEGSKDTYTVVGYSVAEMSASTSGYAPVYYSVDADGSQTPIALGETSNGQYMIQGDSPKVISENAISLMMLTDLPAKLSYIGGTPLDFYPVKENMVLENVPTNQLTVKKIWAEGTIPEEITVELYPVGLIDGKQIVADDPAALFPDVTWTVTLNEKNNWQYQWTDLPTQVETVDDENNPVTLDFIYCVRETPTAHYQPTYTDGNGQTLQPTLTVANKDHIPAVLRPNDGVVQITNSIRSTDLTLTKKWQGVETADQKTVSVKLYQKLEGQSATVLDTVTLSAANNWTATVEDLPYYKLVDGQFKEYTYYIREVGEEDGSDYSVTYTDAVSGDKLTKTVLAEGLYGYSINLPADTSADPASVLITNAAYYALPHTGGIGTQWYTLSGMAILITAIALYALMTTRQRNRRKGGEG